MAELALTQGHVALIDDEDLEWLSAWKWSFDSGYAVRVEKRNGKQRKVYMHRELLKTDKLVDHINGHRADNRKANLREATRSQSEHNKPKYRNNTSGFKGVSLHKQTGKWSARIWLQGKMRSLGLFDSPESAFEAYRRSANELHGEFARY